MHTEKSSDESQSTALTIVPEHTAAANQLPTVKVHLEGFNRRKEANIWTLLHTLGIFGCLYLLFLLYASTTPYHVAMDRELHKLEKEVHSLLEMHDASQNATIEANTAAIAPPAHFHEDHRVMADHFIPHERGYHKASRHSKLSRMDVHQHPKRDGSVLTWFHPGTGACGGHNGDNDFIVAISQLIWNGGSHCGDTVTISYQGKTAQATIVDECMSCDSGHIDLSPGLLHYLAGAGTDMVTNAYWTFGSGAPPTPKPKPKPSSTTSSHTSKPTSSKSVTSTSATSTSYSSTSTTESSSSALPSATPTYADDGLVHNIMDINALLIDFGGLVFSGLSAKN